MPQRLKINSVFALVFALGGCADGVIDPEPPPPVGPVIDSGMSPVITPGADTGTSNPQPPVNTPDTGTTPTPPPKDAGTTPPPPADTGVTPPTGDTGTTPPAEAGAGPDTGVVVPVDPGGGIIRGEAPTEASILKDGPCKAVNYTTGFAKPSGVDSFHVYHPTDPSCVPPYAGIAVVPGFVSPESSTQPWGPFLASHGIVAVTIGVPGGDQPGVRATKLLATIESLKKEHTRAGSPLMGKLDLNRMAVSGWSMGGGGTLIAASRTPALKAAMSFAAWGPTGGGQNKVPVLMFQATADILAAGMSNGYYSAVPNDVPKMLFEVNGSSHNVANSPKNHNNIIGAYGLSWMKVYLEGDGRYKQFLTKAFPSITTNVSKHNLK